MEKKDKNGPLDILSELPGLDKNSISDIEDRLKEIKDRTTDFVQKNPLTSIAIAVGIGYVIAKLFSGRRS
ncbi:DUF883 C-terminal domain-containing protein [Bacteriovorax sp. PP10]|uniref:DUF883 C-terminal domain-containing protein n=1 Tax=Bacteriovorax antarcticus TaxID=3088717 RepID=A0ABU5VWS4_9BACT|nr:DUF883 C-terminal domain-containing protein [Bacteriovorax sp. PP10]MEA9357513.1 DUF883 C-terminal domain-containing protein [Bacteriovorax sp. PP10]